MFRILRASSKLSLLGLIAVSASAAGTSHKPSRVSVIDPTNVAPNVGPAPFNAGGPAVSRTVVKRLDHGASQMSISYNIYSKGTVISAPFSYSLDEHCYLSSGHVRMVNEDRTIETGAGELMWRPAGAATRRAEALTDTVSICLMTNAGKVPDSTPFPRYYTTGTSPVLPSSGAATDQGVIQREVLSQRKDGYAAISIVYSSLPNTTSITFTDAAESACWIESGALEIWSAGEKQLVRQGSILFKPKNAVIDKAQARGATSFICFDGPASI